MKTPVLCLDFDFAGRSPQRLWADKSRGLWRLGADGRWRRGKQVLPGEDAFAALATLPLKPGEVLAGWLAYEAGRLVEPTVPPRRGVTTLGEVSVVSPRWEAQTPLPPRRPFALGPARWNQTQAAFEARVQGAKQRIAQGWFYQVNLSMMSRRIFSGDPFDLYLALRQNNPGPYNGFWRGPSGAIVCNSPELLLAAHGRHLLSKPIAGTMPVAEATGQAASHRLRRDLKERAEHVMLVDLIRNDLGRVSAFGSVKPSALLAVEHYSHVSHLVSTVTGVLGADLTAFDALRALTPGGTITGAPKVAAMQHIARHEPHRRGVYTGVMFVFEPPDRLTANLMIRTALCVPGRVPGQGVLHLGAGAGIVADSDPAREWRECRAKLGQFEALRGGRKKTAGGWRPETGGE